MAIAGKDLLDTKKRENWDQMEEFFHFVREPKGKEIKS